MIDGAPVPAAPLVGALAAAGVPWPELHRTTAGIVLFGSRAAGLAGPGSDWDLLCIGAGHTRSQKHLDFVWISDAELTSTDWLTSELAGHVARHGRWLHGDPAWLSAVVPSPAATERKAHRLAGRLAALERSWHLLAPAYRRKHLTLVRRDLQRHALLAAAEPVPPSPKLDAAWHAQPNPSGTLLTLALGARLASAFVEAELAPLY